jgi:hypothetical protein
MTDTSTPDPSRPFRGQVNHNFTPGHPLYQPYNRTNLPPSLGFIDHSRNLQPRHSDRISLHVRTCLISAGYKEPGWEDQKVENGMNFALLGATCRYHWHKTMPRSFGGPAAFRAFAPAPGESGLRKVRRMHLASANIGIGQRKHYAQIGHPLDHSRFARRAL